ncbi:MAG: hypothetical protein ABWZ40_00680 [Caulobacterales bacterium]
MLDGVACVMGLILFLQTNNIICLIAGVALGTAIFASALVKYVKTGRQSAPKFGGTKRNTAPTHPAGSNVTPFRRPDKKKPPHNSNRTSA